MTSAIDRLFADRDNNTRPILNGTGQHRDAQYANDEHGTPYGLKALADEIGKLQATEEGSRDNDANTVALKLGRVVAAGQLSADTVRDALGQVVDEWDYPNGHPFTTRDVDRWMRSGFTAGLNDPRDVAALDQELIEWVSNGTLQSESAPVSHTSASLTESSTPPSTSAGDAIAATSPTPESRYSDLVEREALKYSIGKDAKRLADHRDERKHFRTPPYTLTLRDELALPEEPVTFAIADLIPTGANVVLTAQYKTGKTTMINSLTKALADNEPFLGKFDVATIAGRVGIWNYEVGDQQYRRWLRAVNIEHPERVSILNLRGYRVALGLQFGEEWAVSWLKEHDVSFWVLDPYARAMVGSVTDENNNTEVGAFLDRLDIIKSKAGVSELVIPTHTGRGEGTQDRARGATRLNDWADIQWVLSRNTDGGRFLGAHGRDVDQPSGGLRYDDDTGLYSWTGEAPSEAAANAAQSTLLSWIARNPGIVTRRLEAGPGVNKKKVAENVRALVEQGMVIVIPGPHSAKHHYVHTYEGEFVAVDRMATRD